MCGIVGLIGPGASAADLERLSVTVAHRGPDDDGDWVDRDAGVALGHRRLSIVDLTPAGHQPMVSGDGRWVLALNGEIYDHAEHRRYLEQAGVALAGRSDTEVLLELIARLGLPAALSRVEGMFALALWDRRDRELVLARDRLGEKPLYYGRIGDRFAFASELTALRRLPGAPSRPDPEAVAAYLRWGFVPAPLSILPGLRKLSAGCLLRVQGSGEPGVEEPYWSLVNVARDGIAAPLSLSDRELVDAAEQALRASIGRRLVADVPVGAFLSGGLDSSTVAALAQSVGSGTLRTFTVAVGGSGDESDAAARVARHLGTDHTTLPLPEVDALHMASQVATTYDEPFADPSAIPTILLCAATRQHVTVALSGDGADELLAGYNRYRVARGAVASLLALPRPLRAAASVVLKAGSPGAWSRLGRLLPGLPPDLGTKVHKLAGTLGAADTLAAYELLATQWDPAQLMAVPPAASLGRGVDLPGGSALERMMLVDQVRTLPDNMLVKVDRASMATALEVRVPFLDHRFVELSWHLPERAKVRDGQGKWLVRQVLARHVPRELWDRPKIGFDPPLADWLRGPLSEWAHDLLARDLLVRHGLRPEPILRALADHEAGRRNHDYALWTVLMLTAWLEGTE